MEARLFARQPLLEDDGPSRVAELALSHEPVNRVAHLVNRVRNEHTLAGGQAVRLDDERPRGAASVALGRVGVVEHRELRRRDSVALDKSAS